jgi:superfamily I DNA and/or RNA helicase
VGLDVLANTNCHCVFAQVHLYIKQIWNNKIIGWLSIKNWIYTLNILQKFCRHRKFVQGLSKEHIELSHNYIKFITLNICLPKI